MISSDREPPARPRRCELEDDPVPRPAGRPAVRSDGGQIAFLKVFLALGVLTLLLFDLGKPLVNKVSLDGAADEAAAASSEAWRRSRGDDDAVRRAAEEEAARFDAGISDLAVAPDGTVTLTAEKAVSSMIFGRIFAILYVVKATATRKFLP